MWKTSPIKHAARRWRKRGVAHITIPVNLQELEIDRSKASERNKPHHTSDVQAHGARIASDDELRRAAEVLNAGKKIAILIGQGALHAGELVEQAAEILGAPIIKALLGKAAVPDDSAYTTGGIGLLGTKPSQEAMENCDTLFLIGTSFPYIEFYPKPGKARAVQLELDPRRVGLRYPVEVGLVGDSRATLQDLIPLLTKNENRQFLEEAQSGMRDWWQMMEVQGTRTDLPMKPQVLAWELGKRLAPDAVVSSDSGTITTWWARHIKARRGQMYSCSG
jgi:pyruvate dehydrogenase (quinone)